MSERFPHQMEEEELSNTFILNGRISSVRRGDDLSLYFHLPRHAPRYGLETKSCSRVNTRRCAGLVSASIPVSCFFYFAHLLFLFIYFGRHLVSLSFDIFFSLLLLVLVALRSPPSIFQTKHHVSAPRQEELSVCVYMCVCIYVCVCVCVLPAFLSGSTCLDSCPTH